ncbi:2-amino-4-hydroxy-6-hydroxymethyldihydropteridine diphosphokinase [Carboxylicivirga sp. N1Y90]|uniref:2-amino-4-hydroxy-6- hydroxymethyldihydropteridine diphosphokinase n=1 Tax=Carboxylicivirga fragile TaxID=3417571 RepID=UPI003D3436FE|nr:2-amino-4-hydroxy-6-hydroxymethyldihydropteridine diphosphokinase [Marinilabiliaceae bacterium N1Y90]
MRLILLLGGNQNDVRAKLKLAIEKLGLEFGDLIYCSSYYESEPWGFEASQRFINQVVEFYTLVPVNELLAITQRIEKELGRKEKVGTVYESRPIDIDILFVDDVIMEARDLTIPHRLLHERRFTLLPLTEHWSELIHPKLQKTISELLDECKDEGQVVKVN